MNGNGGPDPVPLDAILGRVLGGSHTLDEKTVRLRDTVSKRYNALRDLLDGLEHISGVHDWELQYKIVESIHDQSGKMVTEFKEYTEHRKQIEQQEAEMPKNPYKPL